MDFTIIESYLEDQPAEKTLLINFGDIDPENVILGRWVMETRCLENISILPPPLHMQMS